MGKRTKQPKPAEPPKASGPTERAKDRDAAGRLKDIGRHRQRVVRLRSELDSAKERVKELKAELKQAIEGLLTEAEQPSLPLDISGS